VPGYDGTGPRGTGPMTGRGEGYCVLKLPEPGDPEGSPHDVRGYAGRQGLPIGQDALREGAALRSAAPVRRATVIGRGRRRWLRRGRYRRWSQW
jgi:hypothetical protein